VDATGRFAYTRLKSQFWFTGQQYWVCLCVSLSVNEHRNIIGVFYCKYIFTHLNLLHMTDYQDILKYCSFVFLPAEIFIVIFKSWSKGHVHLRKFVLFAKVWQTMLTTLCFIVCVFVSFRPLKFVY